MYYFQGYCYKLTVKLYLLLITALNPSISGIKKYIIFKNLIKYIVIF